MSKVSVIGNFCSGIDALNGQTVKTKIVTEELIKVFGENEVVTFNTSGGIKTLFRAPFMAWKAMRMSHNIIFFPAENSLRVFIPLLLFLQLFLFFAYSFSYFFSFYLSLTFPGSNLCGDIKCTD